MSYRVTRSTASAQLDAHGVAPSRSLGQNFLVDPSLVDKIVRLSEIADHDTVVEVGPGLGSLTVALAEKANRVVAVELDAHVLPMLAENLQAAGLEDKVEVKNQDVMKLDWASIEESKLKVVANLPYNIATPLTLEILKGVPAVESLFVMVQLEAGQRLASAEGSKSYGIPSIITSYWADASVVARVPSSVFLPKPRVESALVRIDRKNELPLSVSQYEVFENLVRTGFNKRRKMIRSSLAKLVAATDLEAIGLQGTERPEELDVGTWVSMATQISPNP